jgi:hypothetical protein
MHTKPHNSIGELYLIVAEEVLKTLPGKAFPTGEEKNAGNRLTQITDRVEIAYSFGGFALYRYRKGKFSWTRPGSGHIILLQLTTRGGIP